MEVGAGFKLTDVGVIPNEWDAAPLSDLNPFVTSGSRGWASFYSQYGSLFVRITNLSRESIYLDLSDSKFVSLPPGASEGIRTRLGEDDVLISITADIGIVGYVDGSVPSPAYINQHIALVRFDPAKTCGKFVCYFLASENPQKLFRASTDTGAKAGMSLATVLKIQSALPPISEQRAIATALSDVDALLGGLDRLFAKKRDLKRAAMQQLLTGKTRLPGFDGPWEVKRLGDIAALNRLNVVPGLQPARPFVHFSLPSYDAGKHAQVELGASIGSSKFGVPPTAVLVSKLNPRIPRIWAPASVPENAVASTEWLVLTPRNGFDRRYLFVLCSSPAFCEQMELAATGTTGSHQRIGPSAALDLQIEVAVDQREQAAIVAVLSDMDAELSALEDRRDKTRALKQGMMQELLTGRTRLTPQGAAHA